MRHLCYIICLMLLQHSAQGQDAAELLRNGNNWYTAQQFEKSANAYRSVAVTDPMRATAQYNLGNALFRLDKAEDALPAFTAAAENTKDRALADKAWYNKGVALSKLKRLEESIDAYKNALRRDPADQQARENLQKALLELKKKQPPKKQPQQKPKPQPQMNKKEAEQRLQLLEQKEKQVQQRMQQEKSKSGSSQGKDW
jgi:Ca-activated chloride channel homolog